MMWGKIYVSFGNRFIELRIPRFSGGSVNAVKILENLTYLENYLPTEKPLGKLF